MEEARELNCSSNGEMPLPGQFFYFFVNKAGLRCYQGAFAQLLFCIEILRIQLSHCILPKSPLQMDATKN